MFKSKVIAVVTALVAGTPALATDIAFGAFGGVAGSASLSGSAAATGGIALPGQNGRTLVETRNGAVNQSGAMASLQFVEIDGVRGNRVERDYDGIEVSLDTATYSVGENLSETVIKDRGVGTTGMGGGLAVNAGKGLAHGGFGGFGTAHW